MDIDPGLFERFNGKIKEFLTSQGVNEIRQAILESGVHSDSGNLIDSVTYSGETSPGIHEFEIGAEYSSFLDTGTKSFDMKPSLRGKIIPIKTPAGIAFRRVSDRSTGWIHPGIRPYNYTTLAHEKLQRSIVKVVEDLSELQPEL